MLPRTTRLAPSPTGTLHLGNARTFLVNWALARKHDWQVVLRIEDLDMQRVRPGAAESTIQLLSWLGIDVDCGPIFQSHDLQPYQDAMRQLASKRLIYPCRLTRREIMEVASAPHADEPETPFPVELRPSSFSTDAFQALQCNYRLVVCDREIHIRDEIAGANSFNPARQVGDFVVWTRMGVPSYQLAVVVDDARQGITDVVRGDDLLPSAARQTLLYEHLGFTSPRWWHLPLVLAEDDRRLAKRRDDARLDVLMKQGVQPERIIGLLACWCGIHTDLNEMNAAEFLQSFALDTLPKCPVRFTAEQSRWLLQ